MKNLMILLTLFCLVGLVKGQTASDEEKKAELKKTKDEMIQSFQQSKYSQAIRLAENTVVMSEQIFGKDNPETANCLRNLGLIQYSLKDNRSAEITFERAYGIYIKTRDLDNEGKSNFADLLEALGDIKSQKKVASSEKYYELAISLREATENPTSIKIAKPLSLLANVKFFNQEYREARILFTRLLEILFLNSEKYRQDAAIIYYRTECAYRKSNGTEDFQALKRKYSDQIEDAFYGKANEIVKDPSRKVKFEGVINGKATSLPKPFYPADLIRGKVTGTIPVQVLINEAGDVIHACSTVNGPPSLVLPSELAAYGAKFSPTIFNGIPVKVTGVINYNFVR